MAQYTCYTDCGKWSNRLVALLRKEFEAYNDKDAIRLVLYYCYLNSENFIKIEGCKSLCKIDKFNLPTFEF